MSRGDIASAQRPAAGELNIDHVAHFVPDAEAASAALERLGFTLTPFSEQSHRLQLGGPLVPAGTGNRCIMLEQGYLEFLTPIADTPLAAQLRTAIQRYTGVHLVAFGTGEPAADHARLAAEGFEPLTPVALQRPIGTPHGPDTARFTVVRVQPGTMAEGRIQFCEQQTPELLWQPRWIPQRNGATALLSVLICVEDPVEAARRYGRFTGIAPELADGQATLTTAHGSILFATATALERGLGVSAPATPWIGGYVLETGDVAATRAFLQKGATPARETPSGHLLMTLPEALGGIVVFQQRGGPPLRFE